MCLREGGWYGDAAEDGRGWQSLLQHHPAGRLQWEHNEER